MRAWFILFLAIASEVVGTIALKYAVDNFWIYGVAALCFILAFVLLHRNDLVSAFPRYRH